MRLLHLLPPLAGLLLATGIAVAGAASGHPLDISTPQSFRDQAAQVEAGLQPDGAYAFVSARDRATVEQQLQAMTSLFQRYGTIESMDGARRVELYNAQELINRILTRGRTGATRCAWARQTGSHIPRTLCWSTQA